MFVVGFWSACRPDWQHTSVQRQRYFAMEILQCQTRLDFLIVPVILFLFLLLMYQYLLARLYYSHGFM